MLKIIAIVLFSSSLSAPLFAAGGTVKPRKSGTGTVVNAGKVCDCGNGVKAYNCDRCDTCCKTVKPTAATTSDKGGATPTSTGILAPTMTSSAGPITIGRPKPVTPTAGKNCDCGDKLVVVDCGGECYSCCKIAKREDKKKTN